MADVTLLLDSQPVTVPETLTVLEAARSVGIDIPTLCWMPRTAPWASCLVCAVQIEGSRKLVPSCATRVAEGMSVVTKGPVVENQRRVALELLLSDHVGDCIAPCLTVCPGHLDIPGMNRAIARGEMAIATEIVMDTIPLPATLGRVCPTPCEARCRRKPLDGAVAVCALKRYVGDEELKSETPYVPPIASPTGKRVAIIGAGPAGIAAAYFLRRRGHECTVYDEREKAGGALRDIPEDELPKAVLDAEVAVLARMGVEMRMGQRVELGTVQCGADAVVLACGPVSATTERTPTKDPAGTEESSQRLSAAAPLEGAHPKPQPSEGSGADPPLSLAGIDLSDRGIRVVKGTGETNVPGVFAAGAAVAPSKIAIRSIGDGHAVANAVHTYLTGEADPSGPSLILETDKNSNVFATTHMVLADPTNRVEAPEGLTEEDARAQAARCLQCGCAKADDCLLRVLSSTYGADPRKFKGPPRVTEIDNSHEEVVFEPGKCIFCGICVRIAAEQGEASGLAYHGRGFDMAVEGPFGEPLAKALRKAARLCAEACPTGALYVREKLHER